MVYCAHEGKTFRFEMLLGLAGYNAHPINDVISNNNPYVIELSFGTLGDFNDGDISGKIYTKGMTVPFELNGLQIDFLFAGSYHIPGSYASFNIKIDYLECGNVKSFEMSKTTYNGGWYFPKDIAESIFREVHLLSQCKTLDNYNLVKSALNDIYCSSNTISLNELNDLTNKLCKSRQLIYDNSVKLPEDIKQKIKAKLAENVAFLKEKIATSQIVF